jgi:tRNA G26 N,N-dimethylase Trm1
LSGSRKAIQRVGKIANSKIMKNIKKMTELSPVEMSEINGGDSGFVLNDVIIDPLGTPIPFIIIPLPKKK